MQTGNDPNEDENKEERNSKPNDDFQRYDKYDDLEAWEEEADMFYQKEWQGLIEYRRRNSQRYPDCQYTQWSQGEAYVLNGEYEKAISFLGDLHNKYPDDPNIHHSLLNALMAVGKDETAFAWVIKTKVLKLDRDVLDFCYSYMRYKRKPRMVEEVYLGCYSIGYPMFSAEQLLKSLYSDTRFILTGDIVQSYDCFVAVKRK
ncbi:MAG: tetratricopeptide repeat protein [Lachnospiraceae bacterium]